ncbi:MAG: CoA transferase [Chloroflexi bacterium]|nr:CoA transferase [Chloroflexota bacterium]
MTSEAGAAGALAGIRVLEFSQIVAAPFGGVVLSDYGADVVKVEPLEGESYRASGAIVPGEGKRFQSLNRGKRSFAVNLQTAEGQALIHRIIPQFDAVLINYRPGVPERLHIDYDTLKAIHPGIIYASITGFGEKGPLAGKGATDLAAGAYTGLIAGDEKIGDDDAPEQMTPAISDYVTGLICAMSITAALYHHRETGKGQRIDASLLNSALAIQDFYVMRQDLTDAVLRDPMIARLQQMRREGANFGELVRARRDYRWASAGPPRLYYAGYNAKDGALVLGCLTKPTRAGARKVLAMHHETTDDENFDLTNAEHQARVTAWKDEIAQKMRTRTVAEWVTDFEAEGVPAAPVQFPEEMADDPQVVAMEVMVDFDHPVTGHQKVVGPMVRMSETPTKAYRPAPALAAHTVEVLLECGVTAEEAEGLRTRGVIR